MKKILPFFFASLLALPVIGYAEEPENAHQPDSDQERQTEPERGPRRPPPKHPIMEALDKNRDHVIDEDEIKGAPEALRSLDENGDGKLTKEEFRPEPPEQKDSGQEGDDDQMTSSERRKMEREQRRQDRQSGNQQGQGRPQGPPPPPPPSR